MIIQLSTSMATPTLPELISLTEKAYNEYKELEMSPNCKVEKLEKKFALFAYYRKMLCQKNRDSYWELQHKLHF